MSEAEKEKTYKLTAEEVNLYETIKKGLQQNGDLNKFKAQLQAKIFQVISGKSGGPSASEATPGDHASDPRIKFANQLILEYFHWFGYQYSVEMFATESGVDTTCPSRQSLESQVGDYKIRDIPILLEMVLKSMAEKMDN